MNEEFHKPFIKSLLVVAIGTVVFMVSSHFLVEYYFSHYSNTQVFTSAPSEFSQE